MVEADAAAAAAIPEAVRQLRETGRRQCRQARADRLRRREAATLEPFDWRARHAPGVALVPVPKTGAVTPRVLLPIEAMAVEERRPKVNKVRGPTRDVVAMLERRGVIGLIHVRAAQALLDDAETAVGARQPREAGRSRTASDLCHMDVQMWCSGRLREARAAVTAAGPLAWPAVKAVVLDGQTLSSLAGSRRTRDIRPWVAALTEGLMAAARDYKMIG
jgi:hypothetical protein